MPATTDPSRPFFQGSELPRLIFLCGVLVAGGLLLFSQLDVRRQPSSPPPKLEDFRPPPPADTGPIFEAVEDKARMLFRENAAYAELLRRARETPPAEIAEAASRHVLYTHLWEDPKRYRGVPIHIEGVAMRSLSNPAPPSMAPAGVVHEIWMRNDDSGQNPFVLVIQEPPPGFPASPRISEAVAFDGYFFKLLRYQAADNVPRAAPLLVGRLRWIPGATVEQERASQTPWFFVVMAVLALFSLIRLAFYVPRYLSGPKRPRKARDSNDAAFAEWLAKEKGEDDPGPLA